MSEQSVTSSGDAKDLITVINLYLLQTITDLAREDIAEAMLRFGISRDLVERLSRHSMASLYEIAKDPMFLFSIDEGRVIDALKDYEEGQGYRSMHQVIVALSRETKKKEGAL